MVVARFFTYFHLGAYVSVCDSTALVYLGRYSSCVIYIQWVGFLGRGISPSQALCLHTEQHKHRMKAHADFHALSGIRTHDPSVRAGEDGSYLSAATVT
jgi:hypothetical protein